MENPPAVAFAVPEKKRGKAISSGLGQASANDVEPIKPDSEKNAEPQKSYGTLAALIRQAWTRNYRSKELIDYRLLANLRARRAKYSPEDQALYTRNGVSPPYEPLAAVKMRAAEAAINELILPDGDRNWSINPSPLPELPEDIAKAVDQKANSAAQAQMQQATAQGQPLSMDDYVLLENKLRSQMYDAKQTELLAEAKDRAARMELSIEELMRIGGYYAAMREFTSHFATFPAAILKGPYNRTIRQLKWRGNKPEIVEKPSCAWSVVNPFDAYPAPQARSAQDGDFIERLRLTRAELASYRGVPGYDSDAITRVLQLQMNGNLQSWLWSDIQRREIEGYTTDIWKPDYFVDALHYWGTVSGYDLRAQGITDGVDDLDQYYEIDAVLIDNEVIRCEVNDDPLKRRPYHVASYDPIPGAFWGNSIYDLMEDCQGMVNAALRALNANMGLASGPIMGIDMSKLADGEDPKAIAPLQLVQLDTGRSQNQDAKSAITFWQANSNANELRGIMETFKQDADDLTGIPRYLSGDPHASGAGETLGGLSLLMGSAAKGLRRAAAVIDANIIEPTVTRCYEWLMMHGDVPEAKGDCHIIARGSAAILIKEHLQQTRMQFLSLTANPIDMGIIGQEGRRAVLEQVVKALEMPTADIVPTSEQLNQRQQSAGPPQPSPDQQLKSQTDLEKAKGKDAQAQQKMLAGFIDKTADQTGISPLQIAAALGQQAQQPPQAPHQPGAALGGQPPQPPPAAQPQGALGG